jgi:uncharacterized membrane protein YphA (DoxX/SURF4 family)
MGALFVVTGVLKLRDPAGFAQDIANYQMAAGFAPVLAIVLPTVEIVAGLALVALPGPWRRGGAVVLAGLMAVFTAAAGVAIARGLDINCGCFGTGSGPVGWTVVLRDVALLGVALMLATRAGQGRTAQP